MGCKGARTSLTRSTANPLLYDGSDRCIRRRTSCPPIQSSHARWGRIPDSAHEDNPSHFNSSFSGISQEEIQIRAKHLQQICHPWPSPCPPDALFHVKHFAAPPLLLFAGDEAPFGILSIFFKAERAITNGRDLYPFRQDPLSISPRDLCGDAHRFGPRARPSFATFQSILDAWTLIELQLYRRHC